jgi:hypothetical protein
MKPFILCLLTVFAVPGISHADVTKLPAEHNKALQDVSRFREVHAVTNLPPAVVALCADHNGRIAEPGQKWQVTDVITDNTLPRKRLIWAATDGDYYVVHYESGGIAHSYHAMVMRLKRGDDKLTFRWHGVGSQLKDFRAFLEAVKSNKLDDTLDYAH